MESSQRSKHLFIFEGCDGCGKTTAAKEVAEQFGAHYVHFPALPRVKKGLARMYVEAMLPALLGYQDVVFDRSWLSETPYGQVFREGLDRLTLADRRMLERLAMRCGATVIHCLTDWSHVVGNYRKRKGQEMLRNEAQLRDVYNLYGKMRAHLPLVSYDFKQDSLEDAIGRATDMQMTPHPLNIASAGNWDAGIVLVGEGFAERKDQDAYYQWPFASFSGEGCSQWLTEELDPIISESELLWLNSDQDLSIIHTLNELKRRQVVALGTVAAEELREAQVAHETVSHPQHHKRFFAGKPYELINIICPE